MRDAWGHIVDVTGIVTRDAESERPLAVRRVTSVDVVPEGEALGFLRPRGAIQCSQSSPTGSATRHPRSPARTSNVLTAVIERGKAEEHVTRAVAELNRQRVPSPPPGRLSATVDAQLSVFIASTIHSL